MAAAPLNTRRLATPFATARCLTARLLASLIGCLLAVSVAGANTDTGANINGNTGANTLPNPYDAFRLMDETPAHQIPLLGDRFRIDDHIDEITMVFFREPNSRPVVLILPDGSKWYSSRHPEQVQWETGSDFDQVRIKTPMRGPWQVSGELRAESRLLVISDLQLNAEPLPQRVFQGERLPISGSFTEAGHPIEQRDFRNAIELTLYLVSTNQQQYENFGLNPRQVGRFKDDGRGMDARARDGVFTGSIDFNVPTGAYLPSYRAVTPLYQRSFEQTPIQVTELPIEVEVELGSGEASTHQVRFIADEYYLNPDDIIIRGEIVFPNGERQLIDRSSARGEPLLESITSSSYGIFTVRTTLYATTQHDGREIVAQMRDVDFTVRPPPAKPAPVPEETEPPGEQTEGQAEVRAEVRAERKVDGQLDRQADSAARESAAQESVAQSAWELGSVQLPSHWIIAAIVATNLLLVMIWFIIMWRRRR